jgi:hypothetical protein
LRPRLGCSEYWALTVIDRVIINNLYG